MEEYRRLIRLNRRAALVALLGVVVFAVLLALPPWWSPGWALLLPAALVAVPAVLVTVTGRRLRSLPRAPAEAPVSPVPHVQWIAFWLVLLIGGFVLFVSTGSSGTAALSIGGSPGHASVTGTVTERGGKCDGCVSEVDYRVGFVEYRAPLGGDRPTHIPIDTPLVYDVAHPRHVMTLHDWRVGRGRGVVVLVAVPVAVVLAYLAALQLTRRRRRRWADLRPAHRIVAVARVPYVRSAGFRWRVTWEDGVHVDYTDGAAIREALRDRLTRDPQWHHQMPPDIEDLEAIRQREQGGH